MMNRDYNCFNGKFQHLVLEGTPYEVGKMQGELLKNEDAMRTRIKRAVSSFLGQLGVSKDGKPDLKTMGLHDFRELQAFFEEYCPGLNEEMQGFADSMGIEIGMHACAAKVL